VHFVDRDHGSAYLRGVLPPVKGDRDAPVPHRLTAPARERTRQLRRVALSGLLGSAVEFYDFLVYGTVAALVFGDLFFPGTDPAVGTIAAFGTFAAQSLLTSYLIA